MASTSDQMLYAVLLSAAADELRRFGEWMRARSEKMRASALRVRSCVEEETGRARSTAVDAASVSAAQELFALADEMTAFAEEACDSCGERIASSLVARPSYEEIRRKLDACCQMFQVNKDKSRSCIDKLGAFADKMKGFILKHSPLSASDLDCLIGSFAED